MCAAKYDVAVIGAGPAGSAAAYFLARGGLHVALLDKFNFPRDKTCGDGLTPRALKVLDAMGVLPQIEPLAFRCAAITLRHSDAVTYQLELTHLEHLPHYILVQPRFSLDDILRQYAMSASAEFVPNAKVESLTRLEDGSVRLHIERRPPLECALAVVATGSNTGLLRQVGLLSHAPPSNLAARAYFENVEGLDDSIMLFFDGIDLPGYGWVFPTAPGMANIGCGVFFDSHTPQPSRLRQLVQEHPHLQRILKNARQVGPTKGYPLRTDFSPAHSGNDWALVVGESVGLVNPITGEGIDYALESAQLAATAVLEGWQKNGASPAIQKRYRQALGRKFRYQLALNHLAQQLYFRDGALDNLLRRAWRKPYLRQAIVDACFGSANPVVMVTPRTLWEVFGP
jgi:geranylgeranyl reductase family protein